METAHFYLIFIDLSPQSTQFITLLLRLLSASESLGDILKTADSDSVGLGGAWILYL